MKRILKIVVMVLVLVCLAACARSTNLSPLTVKTAYPLTVVIQPGAAYEFSNPLPILPKRPSILAIWLETTDGAFIDTLFSSSNAVTGKWYNSPKEGRPEALPVWTHAVGDKCIDAASGATPKGGDTIAANVSKALPLGSYIVKLEVNACYDFNKTWAKGLPSADPHFSGVNGQPSVVYSATIEPGSTDAIPMILVGAGSASGNDGGVHELDGMTTAMQIIKQADVRLER